MDVTAEPLASSDAALLAVAAFAGEGDQAPPVLAGAAAQLGEALGVDLTAELSAVGFRAGPGELARVPTRGAVAAATVVVVGLGPVERAGTDQLRRAAAAVAGAAERIESLATDLPGAVTDADAGDAVAAVVEGLLLGSYRFSAYRSAPAAHQLESVTLQVADVEAARTAVHEAEAVAGATRFARDLVNTPPQDKRPPALADRVAEAFAGTDVRVRILDEQALVEGGYGGILGVGRGSSEPPRLVELTYEPDGAERSVALVGKGITFDTGGISLKPSESMETMKMDMAGAATVAAVVRAAAELRLPVKVTGLLALAENMPSGTATRVSDVLTMKGGTTVEVINTDAEGRLVLGDALVHASELQPDAIVDVATLTGAAVVALGERIGVLMASDDTLAERLLDASAHSGEPFWRLPLANEQYGERLEGAIADLRNSGSRSAGTIFAGLFLHRFVGEGIPWAHLDIAGVAWTDEASGYHTKGATGVPVRTLLRWLRAG
ncbi:putative cytosol aminopeptidase [Egicoccus halophilus]|uniref:Probable cytosol aminopeptidase n=1 Tax=Egicoccus halophilus TaxID=1670830 RepID=A0A8J3EVC7_9ACTN|nr:putative cytosol aminopeptidase [Egicoccus halophilus]